MKYISIAVLLALLPFIGFAQVDTSGILGSDSCQNNGIQLEAYRIGVKKIIPLKFHVIQDLASERNFPNDANTQTIFNDIVDRVNEKLNNNRNNCN